eukprot:773948-Prymnesium_polylepis.1
MLPARRSHRKAVGSWCYLLTGAYRGPTRVSFGWHRGTMYKDLWLETNKYARVIFHPKCAQHGRNACTIYSVR